MAVTKLKLLRESEGRTQKEQADALGLSLATYAPIERGLALPTERVRKLLELQFGGSIKSLLAPVRVRHNPAMAIAEVMR